MGFGELFVVQGHAGQVIQVVDHGANALSGVCVSMQRMSKRTVTQMKLRNRIEGRAPFSFGVHQAIRCQSSHLVGLSRLIGRNTRIPWLNMQA